MIEFGKITGECDGRYIQVKMRTGECLFAPLSVMGNSVSLPSENWIKTNKDNFLALVTYEKNIWDSPIVIGFYPVRGANSATFNVYERLLSVVKELVGELQKAQVNTQIGPQKFLPDTQMVLKDLETSIDGIQEDINPIRL